MSLSDFIAVMRDGKLVQFGAQREVYSRPQNTYVATFVGKPRMSLLRGALAREDDCVRFRAPGVDLNLGSPASLGLADGDFPEAILGIRAEDVTLAPSGSVDERPSFDAEVRLIEPIGSDSFVELAVGDQLIVARVQPDREPALGDHVSVGVAPGRVHLFEAVSGERIAR